MNLKDAFRYQSFLNSLMEKATDRIEDCDYALNTTEYHYKNKANPEAEDEEKQMTSDKDYTVDDVIRFADNLISFKVDLTEAITKAKAGLDFDMEAAIQSNKLRQKLAASMKFMLARFKANESIRAGRAYRFNVEGNEVMYTYEIKSVFEENFDREEDRVRMKLIMSEADRVSNEVDVALTTANVAYNPPFDINDSFDEALEEFLKG